MHSSNSPFSSSLSEGELELKYSEEAFQQNLTPQRSKTRAAAKLDSLLSNTTVSSSPNSSSSSSLSFISSEITDSDPIPQLEDQFQWKEENEDFEFNDTVPDLSIGTGEWLLDDSELVDENQHGTPFANI
jgi:hypothetical protein